MSHMGGKDELDAAGPTGGRFGSPDFRLPSGSLSGTTGVDLPEVPVISIG
jgi:hypothetical protein